MSKVVQWAKVMYHFYATWCKVWITTDDSLNLGGPDDTLEDVS